jgi:predicted nucleic acid-binding protein
VITHFLDTSAVLAHYLRESGADEVNALLHSSAEIGLSVLSLVELRTRLETICPDRTEIERVFDLYANRLLISIAVDRKIAATAIELRANASLRVPLVDSIIAASAISLGAILVHRDPHLAAISQSGFRQVVLPPKQDL